MDAGKTLVCVGSLVWAIVVLWAMGVCWVQAMKGRRERKISGETFVRKYKITLGK